MDGLKVLNSLQAIARELSNDRKTQVGAGCFIDGTLVGSANILYEVLPEYDIANRTELFYNSIVHAEYNLCHKLGNKLQGKTVYVTLFPCNNCTTKLIKAGVKEIIVLEDRPTASYIIKAKELLAEAGIPWKVLG